MPKKLYREQEMREKMYREGEIEIMARKQEDTFTSQKSELGIRRIGLFNSYCIGIGKLIVKNAKFSCLVSLTLFLKEVLMEQ